MRKRYRYLRRVPAGIRAYPRRDREKFAGNESLCLIADCARRGFSSFQAQHGRSPYFGHHLRRRLMFRRSLCAPDNRIFFYRD